MAQIAPYDDFSHTPSHYAARAQAGDAQAQFYLGLAIEALGPEATERWGEADDWFRKAAAAGLPEALHRHAQIALAQGKRDEARASFDAAAEAGLVDAQFNRARMAEEDGDAATALRWYRKAARAGHGPSRFNLALLTLNEDRPDAAADALAWLILAAESDVPNAAAARDALSKELGIAQRFQARNFADARR